MLTVVVSFLFVIVGNLPQCEALFGLTHISIVSLVEDSVDDIKQNIRDDGLDPFYKEKLNFSIVEPIPINITIKEWWCNGLSDIVINSADYDPLDGYLNFDFEIPFVNVSIGSAVAKVVLPKNTYNIESSGRWQARIKTARWYGDTCTVRKLATPWVFSNHSLGLKSLEFHRMRIAGRSDIHFDIFSLFSIGKTKTDLTLGSIQSDMKLKVQHMDFSIYLNRMLSSTVPLLLKQYGEPVNEILGMLVTDLLKTK